MSNEKCNLLVVAAFAGFLMMGLWYAPVSAAFDVSGQSGGTDTWEFWPPSPSAPSVSDLPSPTAKSQVTDPDFWGHARDPFAIPDASQLCSRGVAQACAIPTPSD